MAPDDLTSRLEPNIKTKSFQFCLAVLRNFDYFVQETDELVRLINIFGPIGTGVGPNEQPYVMP